MPDKKLTDKSKLNRCPNCRSRNLKYVHCLSSRLPWWWYIECFDCHCCGKTKLGLNRAIKSWNKESEKEMEKRLTDNEIVKALECCSVQEHFVCDECPAWVDSHCIGTHKQTLDLINRLRGENKSQSIMIKMLNGSIEDYKNSYINQKAEIERLTVLADLGNMRANDYRAMRDKCKTAKAEAYKECIEKVKSELKNIAKIEWQDNYYYLVGTAFFDNLLEELVGDK